MVELRLGLINNVERKFIPTKKEFLEEYLQSLQYIEEYELIQTYQDKVKYRCYNDHNNFKYTRNIKMKGVTDVIEIDKETFNNVLKENDDKCIRKIRKYYLDGKYEIDVDYFIEPLDMIMVEVETDSATLEDYIPPRGFIEVTGNEKYENIGIFNGSIISNNTILEGTDAVGKTTTITALLQDGIICQDRCMDVISVNMLFEIPMDVRTRKYQEYLKRINKKIIIMINTDKKELEKRINKRKLLSEFDSLAYEYNKLYMETYEYMKLNNMLENKMFLVDCTGLTIDEQVKAVKKIIL